MPFIFGEDFSFRQAIFPGNWNINFRRNLESRQKKFPPIYLSHSFSEKSICLDDVIISNWGLNTICHIVLDTKLYFKKKFVTPCSELHQFHFLFFSLRLELEARKSSTNTMNLLIFRAPLSNRQNQELEEVLLGLQTFLFQGFSAFIKKVFQTSDVFHAHFRQFFQRFVLYFKLLLVQMALREKKFKTYLLSSNLKGYPILIRENGGDTGMRRYKALEDSRRLNFY